MSVVTINNEARVSETGFAAWVRDVFRSYEDWRAYRRTVAELSALSDRELADIGLGRSQIAHAARHGLR